MSRRLRLDPQAAVAVLRTSKGDDNRGRRIQELGAEAQRAAIEAWAIVNNVRIVAWVDEKITGGADWDDREGLRAAVDTLRACKAGVMVFHKVDRLARSGAVYFALVGVLDKLGASIRTVVADAGDDPMGRAFREIQMTMASLERSHIADRTRAALAVKRARGEALGAPGRERYGWTRGEGAALVEVPEEQATIARARELRASGLSVRQVSAALAAEGRMGRNGGPLRPATVWKVTGGGEE